MSERTELGWQRIAVGVGGAALVAGLHELSRRLVSRMPRPAIQARGKATRAVGWAIERVGTETALLGLVGLGTPKRPLLRGALIGAGVGLTAVLAPRLLGGARLRREHLVGAVAPVATYVVAGLAAGLATLAATRLGADELTVS